MTRNRRPETPSIWDYMVHGLSRGAWLPPRRPERKEDRRN